HPGARRALVGADGGRPGDEEDDDARRRRAGRLHRADGERVQDLPHGRHRALRRHEADRRLLQARSGADPDRRPLSDGDAGRRLRHEGVAQAEVRDPDSLRDVPGAQGHAAGVCGRARADFDEGVFDQSGGQARVLGVARSSEDDDDLNRTPTDEEWARLQFTTVLYYLHETNPDNGRVRDQTDPRAPVSIAAVGMALATMPVVVERGIIIREFAAKITRRKLRFLLERPQGPEPDVSGYKGFFYHFLDIETGGRVW